MEPLPQKLLPQEELVWRDFDCQRSVLNDNPLMLVACVARPPFLGKIRLNTPTRKLSIHREQRRTVATQ